METRPRLVTDKELARHLRVSVDWLRREAQADRLPHVKADDRFLFNAAIIEQVLLDRATPRPVVRKRLARGGAQ